MLIYCQYIDFPTFANSYVHGVRVTTPVTYAVPPQPDSEGHRQESFALLTDSSGNITECRHANFMFVKDGRLKVPYRKRVLAGISMETILELAGGLGIPIDEADYSPGDVYGADEALVSGTRFSILPVATFNGLDLREGVPGPVTQTLTDAWSESVGVDIVKQALYHLDASKIPAAREAF